MSSASIVSLANILRIWNRYCRMNTLPYHLNTEMSCKVLPTWAGGGSRAWCCGGEGSAYTQPRLSTKPRRTQCCTYPSNRQALKQCNRVKIGAQRSVRSEPKKQLLGIVLIKSEATCWFQRLRDPLDWMVVSTHLLYVISLVWRKCVFIKLGTISYVSILTNGLWKFPTYRLQILSTETALSRGYAAVISKAKLSYITWGTDGVYLLIMSWNSILYNKNIYIYFFWGEGGEGRIFV